MVYIGSSSTAVGPWFCLRVRQAAATPTAVTSDVAAEKPVFFIILQVECFESVASMYIQSYVGANSEFCENECGVAYSSFHGDAFICPGVSVHLCACFWFKFPTSVVVVTFSRVGQCNVVRD